jgi:hypothetical protein
MVLCLFTTWIVMPSAAAGEEARGKHLFIPNSFMDFGRIQFQSSLFHSFSIQNAGEEPVSVRLLRNIFFSMKQRNRNEEEACVSRG